MFADEKEENDMLKLIEEWTTDPQNLKGAFMTFKDQLEGMKDAVLSFNARPGVSYSLRETAYSLLMMTLIWCESLKA